MNKNLISFSFLFLIALNVFSQHFGGGKHTINIQGKILDAETKEALEFATINLVNKKDSSTISGTISKPSGDFILEDIHVKPMFLKISFIGYNDTIIQFNQKELFSVEFINLKEIHLSEKIIGINEIEIEDEKNFMEMKIDKKIYNAEKNLTAAGGSALTLLQNIPSVDVDIDGNVSLRGNSNLIVLINGRPSGLTGASRNAILDQIPASSIKSIEVITNPSAKYDPDGMTGIINIILKKNVLQGFNGNISYNIGNKTTESDYKHNASLNLNYRNRLFNLFGSYSYRNNSISMLAGTKRYFYYTDSSAFLNQDYSGLRNPVSHLLKVGTDIFLSKTQTLSLSYTLSQSLRKSSNEEKNLQYAHQITPFNAFIQFTDRTRKSLVGEYSMFYDKKFKKKGQNLSISANYSSGDDNDENDLLRQSSTFDFSLTEDSLNHRLNITDESYKTLVSQIDYVHPFNKKTTLESGFKYINRYRNIDFLFQNFDYEQLNYERDTALSNHFIYEEQLISFYSTFAKEIKKFGVKIGARLEQTLTNSEQRKTNTFYENNYFNIFPSVHLSYKLNTMRTIAISYSKRVYRPSIYTLNPVPDYSDPLNIRSGNPYLQPQFTHSFEINMLQFLKKGSFSPSIYYRQTNNIISRFKTVDENGISYTTFQNFAKSYAYGVELIWSYKVKKWWNFNISGNFYQNFVDGSNLESDINSQSTSWSTRFMTNFKIGKKSSIQVSSWYRAPVVHGQGRMKDMFFASIAAKTSILKKKVELSMRLADMFNTQRFAFDMSGTGFSQSSIWDRESRILYLGANYIFGKQSTKKFNKNKQNQQNNGGGDFGL